MVECIRKEATNFLLRIVLGKFAKQKLGEWNHIPSAQHPAGHGTRGKKKQAKLSSVTQ